MSANGAQQAPPSGFFAAAASSAGTERTATSTSATASGSIVPVEDGVGRLVDGGDTPASRGFVALPAGPASQEPEEESADDAPPPGLAPLKRGVPLVEREDLTPAGVGESLTKRGGPGNKTRTTYPAVEAIMTKATFVADNISLLLHGKVRWPGERVGRGRCCCIEYDIRGCTGT